MNKMMILICIVAAIVLVNFGLSMHAQVNSKTKQATDILIQNNHMGVEILNRQLLKQRCPKSISQSLSLVINDIRYLEENSGTVMDLVVDKAQENEVISNHYIESQYRGIKKLPVLIQVNKFSNETDMGAVLNDIYQLEEGTDFKASEINKSGDALIVKGDVYGF